MKKELFNVELIKDKDFKLIQKNCKIISAAQSSKKI